MAQLGREYIDSHRGGVQLFESVGRALTDATLGAAADKLDEAQLGEGRALVAPATVRVRPVSLGIYACIPIYWVVSGVQVCKSVHGETARTVQDRVVAAVRGAGGD